VAIEVTRGVSDETQEFEPIRVDAALPADRFLDRELSWLAFNQRVLELAEDQNLPLLERAKFLAIFTSNLDEFFMVRVAGLKRRIAAGIAVRSASGGLPRAVHETTLATAHRLTVRQARVYRDEILPALAAEGIEVLHWSQLTDDERAFLGQEFRQRVFPVLTPLAVDPSHPFPYISGLSLNLAVLVGNPQTGAEHFARVKVPPLLSRFQKVGKQRFVPLEEIIAAHLGQLFPGMEVVEHHAFRVTRNEELEVEEDDAENLLQAMERELMRRRFGPAVRLEVEETINPRVLELLMEELEVTENEVFQVPGPLDLRAMWDVHALDRDDLKQRKFVPRTSRAFTDVESSSAPDVLEVMRERDILLHHPYDSFSTSVQLFIEQAASDPHVLAIKQTLYRTSGDSPIVKSLMRAAELGKQVLAIVEIKARFDEQNNIEWARKMEEAGVHVVYGVLGFKTHCKLSMVVRDEGDSLRRYVHIGTGNYHPKTARNYEDLSLLTTDPDVTEDIATLFNHLSGYSNTSDYARLLVAPHSVRPGLIEHIDNEIAHHEAGRPAGIRFKCNALVDEQIIDALYRASRVGVPVDIWVRGICTLRPGIPGLSESVRVRSILGRFLEHSRIYEFTNGGDRITYTGSPDLMHRNLDRRVEVLVQVSPEHSASLANVMDLGFAPDSAAWHLQNDGSWLRVHQGPDGTALRDVQEHLIDAATTRG
jgi:polyphosphate kinase